MLAGQAAVVVGLWHRHGHVVQSEKDVYQWAYPLFT